MYSSQTILPLPNVKYAYTRYVIENLTEPGCNVRMTPQAFKIVVLLVVVAYLVIVSPVPVVSSASCGDGGESYQPAS